MFQPWDFRYLQNAPLLPSNDVMHELGSHHRWKNCSHNSQNGIFVDAFSQPMYVYSEDESLWAEHYHHLLFITFAPPIKLGCPSHFWAASNIMGDKPKLSTERIGLLIFDKGLLFQYSCRLLVVIFQCYKPTCSNSWRCCLESFSSVFKIFSSSFFSTENTFYSSLKENTII